MWGDSGPPTEAKKWLKHKAAIGKRSTTEKMNCAIFLKNHKVLSFPDAKASDAFSAYLKGEEAFLKTEECLLASYAELVAFQAGLSPFAASLAAGARAFAVDGALGPSLAPSGSAAFSTAMSAAELAFKTKLADAMETAILPAVRRKATAMAAVWQHISELQVLKLNADYYADKYQKLQEKAGTQQAKLDINREKSEAASAAWDEASAALLVVFQGYAAIGNTLLCREFELLKSAQVEAYEAMSAEVAALELQRPKYQDERPDVELPEVGGGTVGLASLARASSAASEPDEAAPPLSPRAVEGEGGDSPSNPTPVELS